MPQNDEPVTDGSIIRGDTNIQQDTDNTGLAAVRWIMSPDPIDALLGTRVPADWDDPLQRMIRTDRLGHAAVGAGEAMTELLLRLPGERALGKDPLAEGGAVMACVDANFALHRALIVYRNETVRYDGEVVARATIMQSHGAGIAERTMQALHDLRELIARDAGAVMKPFMNNIGLNRFAVVL